MTASAGECTDRLLRWKYTQTIVMDGNFVSEHLQMKNPADDVKLSDGHGFMVTAERYEAHLKVANDTREVGFLCGS